MYDNLDLTIHSETCPKMDFIQETPQHLTRVTNEGNNQFGEYIAGYLGSLKVSITENRVKIYNSSLCKYYLGDNFKTLSKGDTKQAIEQISDNLHLPFEKANVTRIDAARNLILKHKQKSYFSHLGEAQYYNRLEQNNGLYYNNQMRQLVFYGKVHEQTIKGQPIPEPYKERNVLRYELRFRKKLRNQFNKPAITAALLYDEDFYYSLVKRWKNEYLNIQKINSKLAAMKPTGSTKELAQNLAMYSILELGQPNILQKVKQWQESGEITKKQALDLRRFIKKISKIPDNDEQNDLINELNQKVKEAARFG